MPCLGGIFEWDSAVKKLAQLTIQTEDPNLWDDATKAQSILKSHSYLNIFIRIVQKLEFDLASTMELIELAENVEDEALQQEALAELNKLAAFAKQQELECLFSGEADSNDCFVEIHAGAGGTESYDWAMMLMRMYSRWAEMHGHKVELVGSLPGEEAGIKYAVLKIMGPNSYGWLKTESGVHRLVRMSPFSSAGKRHTSFASAWVYPVVDQNIEVDIKEVDLRIDTYRSSGAGGQHVNTTDSAVRITHIPTGIVVQSQNDRSQHRNRDECMDMLRARLYQLELKRREDETNQEHKAKTDIGWGHQIRSYVLQPYRMIKDLRTGHTESDTTAVLDGKIDGFLQKSLEAAATGQGLDVKIKDDE